MISYTRIAPILEKLLTFPPNKQGVDTLSIINFEQSLKIYLPQSYKEFLKDFGNASFNHIEIYGLGSVEEDFDVGTPLESKFIKIKQRDLPNLLEGEKQFFKFPNYVIPFSPVGNGDYYCFNCSIVDNNGECPVYYLSHEGLEYENGMSYTNDSIYFSKLENNFIDWLIVQLGITV